MKVIRGGAEFAPDPDFAAKVRERSGQNVHLCYQCLKCASGCPARDFMEGSPARVIRYAQLGLKDCLVRENTVWFCSSCQTCSVRCPQDIDIAHVIDTIRILAQEQGARADTKGMRPFNFLWMRMLRYMGRAYELGIAGGLNLLLGRPFKDLKLGARMFRLGKMRLLPSVKRPLEVMRMFRLARRMKP